MAFPSMNGACVDLLNESRFGWTTRRLCKLVKRRRQGHALELVSVYTDLWPEVVLLGSLFDCFSITLLQVITCIPYSRRNSAQRGFILPENPVLTGLRFRRRIIAGGAILY